MSSVAEFRFELDEAYVLTALKRQRTPRKRASWNRVLRWIVTPPFLALAGVLMRMGEWKGSLVFVAVTVLLWSENWLDSRLARRQFARSSQAPMEVRVRLDEGGLHETDAKREVDVKWSGLHKARAFEDGVLLHDLEDHLRWLPYSALVEGTRDAVEHLVRTRVPDFMPGPGRKRA